MIAGQDRTRQDQLMKNTPPINTHGIFTLIAIICLCFPVIGCSTSRKDQLQSLARDWFETIRAEQVIPILPLTADMQPGDVFLVQTPIDDQHKAWKKGDYLPLDNHIYRFDPNNYSKFYENSFFEANTPLTLPREWMRPAPGNSAWAKAPRAAFPTFTFQTSRGGGFNSMLPIQGVPIGLNLLGTTRANGTIVISDARTYGVDMASLIPQLEEWAKRNHAMLAPLGAEDPKNPQNFLRVVSRVYLAGGVDVTIQDARSFSGGTDIGAARPVELLYPDTLPLASRGDGTPAERVNELQNGIDAMNRMLGAEKVLDDVKGLIPGASVRVTSASARTVGMSQTFDPPLVIGYLGFDVSILKGGKLGNWIPTHALLKRTADKSAGAVGSLLVGTLGDRIELCKKINARGNSKAIYSHAAELLGPQWKSIFDQLHAPRSSSSYDLFAELALGYDNAVGNSKDDRRRIVNKALKDALDEAIKADNPN